MTIQGKPVNASHATTDADALLKILGDRVRALRAQHGISRAVLAERSGVSLRYLAQLEQGQGNISVALLARVAAVLGTDPGELLAPVRSASPELRLITELAGELAPDQQKACLQMLRELFVSPVESRHRLALIGLRGAGKSTLGRALATEIGVPFVRLGKLIETLAGMSASEIFSLSGQSGYRRLEQRALLQTLQNHEHCVIETGGSMVTDPELLKTLLGSCFVVWLQARPEQHIERLVAQGDIRPMQNRDDALADLRKILAERESCYARAHLSLDTSSLTVDECLRALVQAVPETTYGTQ